MKIYYIIQKSDWVEAGKDGHYSPPSLKNEGFIHAANAGQVLPTANRRLSGQKDPLLLVINKEKVKSRIVLEDTSGRGKSIHTYTGN